VGVDEIRAEVTNSQSHCAAKRQQEARKREGGRGREESTLMQSAGIGDAFELIGTIAESPKTHAPNSFIGGRASSVGGHHFNVVPLGCSAFCNSGNESACRITGEARIIVGDGEYPHEPLRSPYR
jgi:hypothetical protein